MAADADIEKAFRQRLGTLANHPPIAWENEDFEPVGGAAYLKATLLPAEPAPGSIGIDSYQWERGLFQVSVFVPKGDGSNAARLLAESITALFPRGSAVSNNGVSVRIRRSWCAAGIEEDAWYQVPVSIRYEAATEG